jgi:selenocysteine lyase/cysteine desulfurase
VANLIDVSYPRNIAFAPNTHEFVARIFSGFDSRKPLRVLTTSSEFRSFSRQLARVKERGNVTVTEVPVLPYQDFVRRFTEAAKKSDYDLVFFSQVFYDSGVRIRNFDIRNIVTALKSSDAVIVIDGYHGFCAVDTSLRDIQDRVFYLAGGYKYAQWGEGACFMYVPPNCTVRPENTGWFAEFGELSNVRPDLVSYSDDAFRFWGSTFDPAGLYRLIAVAKWMSDQDITLDESNWHVRVLQSEFLKALKFQGSRFLGNKNLVTPLEAGGLGNFLSYKQKCDGQAEEFVSELRKRNILVDARGPFVRIGFGIYHDLKDVKKLIETIQEMESVNAR